MEGSSYFDFPPPRDVRRGSFVTAPAAAAGGAISAPAACCAAFRCDDDEEEESTSSIFVIDIDTSPAPSAMPALPTSPADSSPVPVDPPPDRDRPPREVPPRVTPLPPPPAPLDPLLLLLPPDDVLARAGRGLRAGAGPFPSGPSIPPLELPLPPVWAIFFS